MTTERSARPSPDRPNSDRPNPPAPSRIIRLRGLFRADATRRVLALLIAALGTALLTVDFVRVPERDYKTGMVADRDVRATTSFDFVDFTETQRRQRDAQAAIEPVYDFDMTLAQRLDGHIEFAFTAARQRYAEQLVSAQADDLEELDEAALSAIAREFLEALDLSLDGGDLQRVSDARWSRGIEALSRDLVRSAMSKKVISDRSELPRGGRAIAVVRLLGADQRDEIRLTSTDHIETPPTPRQKVSLEALESTAGDLEPDHRRASVAVARAAVRSNFSLNRQLTEDRRRSAADGVSPVVIRVNRGTSVVRDGDVLTQQQVDMIAKMRQSREGSSLVLVLLALTFFSGGIFLALYLFGAGFIKKFSTHARDLEAMACMVLLILALARLIVESSGPLTAAIGLGAVPTSMWYAVPFAAGAMLMRVLINSESTIIWITVTAALVGMLMDQQALFSLYFTISGVTAAGALAHTRERVGVLKAGTITGMVQMGAALVINLVQAHLGDLHAVTGSSAVVMWDVGFAFIGGLLSGILVLGLVPIFENFGFVTDFKLLELANLNHPLLKQLMLRAPGTYHHSVTVASLCEAAARSIGANALQVRVACYFHDIGKAVQPQYFIENQRGPNPHDRLPPHTSARIIIAHVVDGAAIAKQHNLPKVITDGIVMHHGTGIIQYFYASALEAAPAGTEVDEADFRYPGELPDSRETGIMMLADKVEAACRTLKDKSPENMRALIQKLINGAIVDGQLVNCPLTVAQLYTIVDAFTETLLGIYHHRIEYPGIPKRSAPKAAAATTAPVITLDVPKASVAGEQAAEATPAQRVPLVLHTTTREDGE